VRPTTTDVVADVHMAIKFGYAGPASRSRIPISRAKRLPTTGMDPFERDDERGVAQRWGRGRRTRAGRAVARGFDRNLFMA
jgi:hypothetical protein